VGYKRQEGGFEKKRRGGESTNHIERGFQRSLGLIPGGGGFSLLKSKNPPTTKKKKDDGRQKGGQ